MGRWWLSLVCALACHGMLLSIWVSENDPVPPRLPGEDSIRIRLNTAVAKEAQPVSPEQEYSVTDKEIPMEKTPDTPRPVQTEKMALPKQKTPVFITINPEGIKKRQVTKNAGVKSRVQQSRNKQPLFSQSREQARNNDAGPPLQVSVDARPLYEQNQKPPYPPLARRRGWQGTVILAVTVSEEGLAEQVTVHKSSGYTLLDTTAMHTANSWHFLPGIKNDHPISMQVLVPVHFRLD